MYRTGVTKTVRDLGGVLAEILIGFSKNICMNRENNDIMVEWTKKAQTSKQWWAVLSGIECQEISATISVVYRAKCKTVLQFTHTQTLDCDFSCHTKCGSLE